MRYIPFTLLTIGSTSNWQIGIGIFLSVVTIASYFLIARMTTRATIEAGRLSAQATTAAATRSERAILSNKLNHDTDRSIELTIQYPYFEDEDYTQHQYLKDIVSTIPTEKEKALRYEVFAMLNFNLIEDLYKFYEGDEDDMRHHLEYPEIIKSHSAYWKYKILEKGEDGYELIKPLVNRILGIKEKE